MNPSLHYTPQQPEPRPWYRKAWDGFCDWLPLIIFVGAIVSLFISIYTTIPRCPKCDEFIRMSDTYCPHCGHQLRTYITTTD
jgi:hypothetical protein